MSDFKALDRLLQGYVDNGLPGCSCMIARRGEILYENYFGYSDVEHQIPLSAQNVFRQASLTKIAMYTNTISSIVNIIGNYLLWGMYETKYLIDQQEKYKVLKTFLIHLNQSISF